jgi:hypothetical protein
MRAAVEAVEHALGPPEIERRAVLALQGDATFSSAVRCGNTAEIWNERTSPRRATSAGAIAVMSCPLYRNLARRRLQNLVSRLKHVVLPAPFGPINA